MADDPDRGLDSDDMLRAAREGIAKPPPTPEDDSSKTPDVQTEATEPNLDAVESTHPDRSQTPMVTSCEIHRTGNLVVNMAMETGNLISRVFDRYTRARRSYELIFEGQEAAQITTSLQPAETWRGPSSSKPGLCSLVGPYAMGRFARPGCFLPTVLRGSSGLSKGQGHENAKHRGRESTG